MSVREHQVFQRNYFNTPNSVIDELMIHMPGAAFKCYLFIFRKTIGHQKVSDRIARSVFENGTGLKRSTLYDALNWLEDNGYIERDRAANQQSMPEYSCNLDMLMPSELPDGDQGAVRMTGQCRPNGRNMPSGSPEQQKTILTKDNTTKDPEDILAGNKAQKQKQQQSEPDVQELINFKVQEWLPIKQKSSGNKSLTDNWLRIKKDYNVTAEAVLSRLRKLISDGIYDQYNRAQLSTAIEDAAEYLVNEPEHCAPRPVYTECSTNGCSGVPHDAKGRCFDCMTGGST